MTFEEACDVAVRELNEAQNTGIYYDVDVSWELSEGGITNPELPPLPADYLSNCGIKRLSELGETGDDSDVRAVLTDDFSGSAGGWAVDGDADYDMGYKDNEYEIAVKKTHLAVWSFAPITASVSGFFVLDVSARLYKGAKGSYGLLFKEKDGSDFCVFSIDPITRTYKFEKSVKNGWETIIDSTSSDLIRAGRLANRLTVAVDNGMVVFYLNEQKLTAASISSWKTPAAVGLCASSEDTVPVIVRFDDFGVYVNP